MTLKILEMAKEGIADAFPLFVLIVFSFALYFELSAFEAKNTTLALILALLLSVIIWRFGSKHDIEVLAIPTKAGEVPVTLSMIFMLAFFLVGIAGIINARGLFIMAHPPVTFDALKAIGKG
jgi:hypothetical protein